MHTKEKFYHKFQSAVSRHRQSFGPFHFPIITQTLHYKPIANEPALIKYASRLCDLTAENQNRVVIWENNALKSFVGVPVPSGLEARSKALNLASSNWSAWSKRKTKFRNVYEEIMTKINIATKLTKKKHYRNHSFFITPKNNNT